MRRTSNPGMLAVTVAIALAVLLALLSATNVLGDGIGYKLAAVVVVVAALIAAEARVPRRVPLGAGTGLAIHSVHRDASDGRERVIVDVAVPEGTPLDLLVEGPTSDWALPSPEPMNPAATSESGVRLFTFDLDGLPPGAHPHGATLTFTVVSPDEAIEVSADSD